MEGLAPCSHEEADSRVMVHVADAANKYNSITTRTVASNVVVFAVNAFGDMTSSLNELQPLATITDQCTDKGK